jgi:hypothetical protein
MKPGLLTVGAVALAACGGGGGPPLSFPATALQTLASGSGSLQIEVRTSPQPPVRGVDAAQYTVTDAQHAPVLHLGLQVTPWMPDMGHGSSIVPTVEEQGNGVYVLTDVDLAMPGAWQLRTTFTGSVSDSVAPQFQIP